MGLYPGAAQGGPLPASNYSSGAPAKIGAVIHVIVGSAAGAIEEFETPGEELSAHFVVAYGGEVTQLLDTNLICYAQAAGNWPPTAYIAIEFEGQPTEAMTEQQLEAGAAILKWASAEHGFPLEGPVAHGSPGVTSHSLPDGQADPAWGDHACPGPIRLAQIPTLVALAKGEPAPAPVPTPPPGPAPAPAGGFDPPTVLLGSISDAVKNVQTLLGGLTVDGVFGNLTRGAVLEWQRAHDLAVDGIVGPQTWTSLLGGAPEISQGANGPAVVALQKLLNRHVTPPTAPLAEDGDFGPLTEALVRDFQTWEKLSVDGVVGPITWSSLAGA